MQSAGPGRAGRRYISSPEEILGTSLSLAALSELEAKQNQNKTQTLGEEFFYVNPKTCTDISTFLVHMVIVFLAPTKRCSRGSSRGAIARKQASTRKACSRSHDLEGLVFSFLLFLFLFIICV